MPPRHQHRYVYNTSGRSFFGGDHGDEFLKLASKLQHAPFAALSEDATPRAWMAALHSPASFNKPRRRMPLRRQTSSNAPLHSRQGGGAANPGTPLLASQKNMPYFLTYEDGKRLRS